MFDGLRFHLRALFRRKAVEAELEEELRDHIERQAEVLRARGLSMEEAFRQARLNFGAVDAAKDDCREARAGSRVEAVLRDVRYAVRLCAKGPGFTCTAVASLAIAIAANTAVFSFVHAIVLEHLPVAGADRLVRIGQKIGIFHHDGSDSAFRFAMLGELRAHDTDFEDILAVSPLEVTFAAAEQTGRLKTEIVSGNYFHMLGVRAELGRLLDDRDDASDTGPAVCTISDAFWRDRLGGRADVLGQTLLLSGHAYQIVGVSQAGFDGISLHEPHQVQVTSARLKDFFGESRDTTMGWTRLLGRLRPGVSRERAMARLQTIGAEIESRIGLQTDKGDTFVLFDGSQGIRSKQAQLGKPSMLLLLLVGIVLLVACANLAAMLLARSVERTREAGVRLALGASRSAIMRQFLSEAVLLAVGGGAVGWLMARLFVTELLRVLGREGEGLASHLAPDAAGFLFCAALTLLAGLLVGSLPAWRAAHAEPLRAIQGVVWQSRRKAAVSRALVAAQVALSMVLVTGAGLFARTLHNLRAVDLGMRPENLILMNVSLDGTPSETHPRPFFDELLRTARQLPGSREASLSQDNPAAGHAGTIILRVPGYTDPHRAMPAANFSAVDARHFRTLGIPLVEGREFSSDDRKGGDLVVMVNQAFARRFLGGAALNRTFAYGGGRKVRVVGVVGDVRSGGLRESAAPLFYVPLSQWAAASDLYLEIRTSADPAKTIAAVRATIRRLEPRVAMGLATTMQVELDQALVRERLLAVLSTFLGGVATVLVAIGLYGVVSFSVARRIHEIGIRMAVGAGGGRIVWLFVREGLWTVAGGIALGLPLAVTAGRLASALLFGLNPGDPLTIAGSAAMLGLVSVAAAILPAWRAGRLDAMAALRIG